MYRTIPAKLSAFSGRLYAAGESGIGGPHGLLSAEESRCGGWMDSFSAASDRPGDRYGLPWLRLQLPFGVVIGDSISAGTPETWGRLRYPDNTPGFNPAHANMPGQLSYEFGVITGLHWFNHGIGGQRTDEIWARWARDVLGKAADPGDGRGERTLPDKAHAVFIVAGINDIFQDKADGFIQSHMIRMAESARDNGIICIFANIGEHNAATPEMREQIYRMNEWMPSKLPEYGAHVVDFFEWSKDPARGFGVSPALFVDNVHPSKAGFQSLSRHFAAQFEQLPVFLRGLALESTVEREHAPHGFGRAELIRLGLLPYGSEAAEGMASRTLEDSELQLVPIASDGTGYLAELAVCRAAGDADRTGFSRIRMLLSDRGWRA